MKNIGWIVLFFIGTFLIIDTGYDIYFGIRSITWPGIQGQIIRSDIVKADAYSYYPIMEYQYFVNRMTWTNNRIGYGTSRLRITGDSGEKGVDMDFARKIISNYPLGKKVVVYYDPKNHIFRFWKMD